MDKTIPRPYDEEEKRELDWITAVQRDAIGVLMASQMYRAEIDLFHQVPADISCPRYELARKFMMAHLERALSDFVELHKMERSEGSIPSLRKPDTLLVGTFAFTNIYGQLMTELNWAIENITHGRQSEVELAWDAEVGYQLDPSLRESDETFNKMAAQYETNNPMKDAIAEDFGTD